MLDDLDIISCEDAAAWELWRAANHGLRRGVWLKIAKKRDTPLLHVAHRARTRGRGAGTGR